MAVVPVPQVPLDLTGCPLAVSRQRGQTWLSVISASFFLLVEQGQGPLQQPADIWDLPRSGEKLPAFCCLYLLF